MISEVSVFRVSLHGWTYWNSHVKNNSITVDWVSVHAIHPLWFYGNLCFSQGCISLMHLYPTLLSVLASFVKGNKRKTDLLQKQRRLRSAQADSSSVSSRGSQTLKQRYVRRFTDPLSYPRHPLPLLSQWRCVWSPRAHGWIQFRSLSLRDTSSEYLGRTARCARACRVSVTTMRVSSNDLFPPLPPPPFYTPHYE